jgi:hypothetical protein
MSLDILCLNRMINHSVPRIVARHILALRAYQMSNRILESSGLLEQTPSEAKQIPLKFK